MCGWASGEVVPWNKRQEPSKRGMVGDRLVRKGKNPKHPCQVLTFTEEREGILLKSLHSGLKCPRLRICLVYLASSPAWHYAGSPSAGPWVWSRDVHDMTTARSHRAWIIPSCKGGLGKWGPRSSWKYSKFLEI